MKTHLLSASLIVGLAVLAPVLLAQPDASKTPPSSALDLNDSLSVEASWALITQGEKLSAGQVPALEAKLRENPKDLTARLQLLGRESHGEAITPAGLQLLLGLIDNHPRSLITGPLSAIVPMFDQQTFKQAVARWQNLIKIHPNDPMILGNAAIWMQQASTVLPEHRANSKVLFEKARSRDPQNPVWAEYLGQAWIEEAKSAGSRSDSPSRQRVASAKKAIEQWDAAFRLRQETNRAAFHLLNGKNYLALMADASLLAGQTNQAKLFARELLASADKQVETWNYGNLLYQYNSFLGLISLREGKPDEAVQYLAAAGLTPGSPQLDSFGPDFALARAILKRGRPEDRSAICQFLDQIARFWANPEQESNPTYKDLKIQHLQLIQKWKSMITEGKIPREGQWQKDSGS